MGDGHWGLITEQQAEAAVEEMRKRDHQHGGHFTVFGQTFYWGTHRRNTKKHKAGS